MTPADGLMAFYAQFDDADVEAYRRWHNCEHMAERVAIPGFLRGRRYRNLDDPRTFLMTYETENAAVLGSDAYHAALNAPTPWTREALTWFRNPARAIYAKDRDMGEPTWRPAPYMLTLRFNLPPAQEAELLNGAVASLLSGAMADGALRARLYNVDEAISGMMTSERKIYSGGPGEQKFIVLIERIEPFDAASDLPGRSHLEGLGASDIFVDRLTIDFALEAPR
ncbi:MAG: hypothetical protein ROR55_24320 [Devosia sp.]